DFCRPLRTTQGNLTEQRTLDKITYIGVSISIASLVICLIIEAVVWKKIRKPRVSYMRHVTVVNIALCLLIADIWFIIGAGISKAKDKSDDQKRSCTAATFFIHLFYLALFFWMLVSGLQLLYHTVSVFDSGARKRTLLAIGFCIGYGAPIIIAVVTIAVTAGSNTYTQHNDVCWLNWDLSKALLAFVIPALTIVVINFLILFIVLYKILRSSKTDEKDTAKSIIKVILVLAPVFGVTWSIGFCLVVLPKANPAYEFFNYTFTIVNSFQVISPLITITHKKKLQTYLPSTTCLGYLIFWCCRINIFLPSQSML
uniref:G-protein coupled receptors family 2 profile 2 domain-containing protein n=1 Tax=Neogobius melanostomus TaxID=47308 RepID=A0A8C6V6S6_9GOBI